MMKRFRAGLLPGLLLAACSGGADGGSGPEIVVPTLQVGGAPQQAEVGTQHTLTITAQVQGAGVPGQQVSVSTTAGTLSSGSVVTSAGGTGSVQLTLPSTPGSVTVTASAAGVSASATIGVVAGAPASVTKLSGDAQSGPAGTQLPQPVRVRVQDRFGNAVANATVTFAGAGGATVQSASVRTDASGEASTLVVLGAAGGAQSVTASAGAVSASFAFTAQASYTSIVVTPSSNTLVSLGEQVQLSAAAKDAAGNTVSGVAFTWSSSNTAVATVSASGQVTAVTNGSATITASAGAVQGSTTVQVQQRAATLRINPPLATLKAGGTQAFTLTAADARGNALPASALTLSSRNAAVASVSGGTATAVAAGSTYLVASATGATDSAAVAVVPTGGYAVLVRPAAGTYADTVSAGASQTVEIAFVLPAGATASLGSVQGSITWDPAKLRYNQATANASALSWIPNENATATGRLSFSAFGATGVNGEFVLATLKFDALQAGATPTAITINIDFAGTAEGASIGDLIIEVPASILIRS